jgi:anion exchange protein
MSGDDNESTDDPPTLVAPKFGAGSAYQGERGDPEWIPMRTDEGSSIRRRRMSVNRDSVVPEASWGDLAPGARVMFLLKNKNEVPSLFTEMCELTQNGAAEEWKETARWVKFEEDVEEGGNRWSKPHVATLSLHALFQLRSCILHGLVLIDIEAPTLPDLTDIVLSELKKADQLDDAGLDGVRHVLSLRHVHQYEQAKRDGSANGSNQGGFLNAVRSISDIGRSFSHGRNLQKQAKDGGAETDESAQTSPKKSMGAQLQLPTVGSVPKDITREGSHTDVNKGNTHFLKKLPPGVEATSVLVGEVDFLSHHITVFARLKTAQILGDLTEVPVPTRFVFILLGPRGHGSQFKEMGRAISTLMADEIFHDVAYKATNRSDLLDGVDEFLDQVTVLPPGEWDPKIRICPPTVIPSQQKRIETAKDLMMLEKGVLLKKPIDDDEPEEHGVDPTLKKTGKFCGGLIADIKRKLPWYASDFTDALNMQCVATFCFMYFALLAPIVTFGGLLEEATHQRMAAMENLFSGAICGTLYHLFSGQPLTVIGSTGPVLVFETILYDLCMAFDFDYLSFRTWVYLWTALILFLMVFTDASALVSYITRFTEECFATLIAVIFIYEAIMKWFKIKDSLEVITYTPPGYSVGDGQCNCITSNATTEEIHKIAHRRHLDHLLPPGNATIDYSKLPLSHCKTLLGSLEGDACYIMYDKWFMSFILMIGTFFIALVLKKSRNSCYFNSRVRQFASDFAVMLAISIMTGIDMLAGINTPKLNVPSTFRPTYSGRGWFIPPFNGNPIWSAPVAIIPALLACVLIFMDQQITAVIVNRRENKLKKGSGYHLDLFVLSFLIIIVGYLGLPIYVAATVLSINHINALKVESESRAPGEVPQFMGVREQRVTGIVTFILIGLSVFMAKILGYIPMPVLYGVFLYMGIAALGGIQLFDRILLFLMPMKYQPDTIYIRHVPMKTINYFTIWQLSCFIALWVIKSIKKTSILFPVMLVAMVAVRKLMEKFFSEKDLKYLDDKMPDFHLRKKEDLRRKSHAALKGGAEEIEIDLDENQGTIHAVKTEAHLHIPMASGNVIKIPLSAIQEPSHNINISKEVNSSGMWRHITSESKTSLQKMGGPPSDRDVNSPRLATPEEAKDDDEAITINIVKSSPERPENESQPLLKNRGPK